MHRPEPPADKGLPPRRTASRTIWAVVLAFVVLATTYSVVTPLFEASDELSHYPLVQHYAEGGGLPVQDPANPGPWLQEGSQPPLYYWLASLISRLVPAGDPFEVLPRNPHADIGIVRPDGNANMVVHTAAESFPYRGTALAIHLVRGFSVLLGALTVLFTYLIGLEVRPRRPGLALAAAAAVAFTPMFLFVSGSVNNDNLVVALATIAVWLTLRLLRRPPTPARWALLGAVIGLASLSKVSALGLLGLAALALGWVSWQRRDWKLFLWGGTCVVGAAALVAGWWYYRNWDLYGDPLGFNVMVAIAGARPFRPSLAELFSEWPGFVKAYWGVFGGMNVVPPEWLYRLCDALALLAAGGLLVGLVRRILAWSGSKGGPAERGAAFRLALVALWPLIIAGGLVRWTMLTMASQGRLMFPAIASLSYLLVLGWAGYVPPEALRRSSSPGSGGHATRFAFCVSRIAPPALLAVCALSLPFGVIAPAYARPPLLTAAELAAIPFRVDLAVGDEMELLGYQVEKRAVQPGEDLSVTLYWRAKAPMTRNYSVYIHLLDENGIRIAQRDMYPGRGLFPTSQWQAGDAIADTYTIQVPANTFRPNDLQPVIGLYSLDDGKPLVVRDAAGNDLGRSIPLAEVAVPAAPEGSIPNPASFDFERQATLAGFDLDRTALHPGETAHLTLFWQPQAALAADCAAFAHVLGSDGSLWAGTATPAGNWPQGQLTSATYDLTLRPDTPPGEYYVDAGLYHTATGQRFNVLDRWGHALDQRAILTRIRVLPAAPVEAAPQFDLPPVQHPLDVTFPGVARLRGYTLDSDTLNPHQPLQVTLHWQAISEAPVPVDYKVFVHLLDGQGQLIAQHDSPPALGTWPTTRWTNGQFVVDRHDLSFLDAAYTGQASLEIGLYDPDTLERLTAADGSDAVVLPTPLSLQP